MKIKSKDEIFDKESIKFFDKLKYNHSELTKKMELWKEIRGKKVLDAGCGTGWNFFDYHLAGAHVVGIDKNKKSLDFLKQQSKTLHVNANVILSDLKNIPLPNNSFDFIFCRGVLQHTSNPLIILREFRRLIKPDGKIRITLLPHKYSLEWIIRLIIQNVRVSRLLPDKLKKNNKIMGYENPYVKAFSEKQLRSMCNDAGLHINYMEKKDDVLTTFLTPILPPIITSLANKFNLFGWHINIECAKVR